MGASRAMKLERRMLMVSHRGQPLGATSSLLKSYPEQMAVSLPSGHTILG